jgi:hypothetical protein
MNQLVTAQKTVQYNACFFLLHHSRIMVKHLGKLRQNTHRNSIMFSKASPRLAKHPKRMTLLQNNTEPIFLLQLDNLIQGGNLARILWSQTMTTLREVS